MNDIENEIRMVFAQVREATPIPPVPVVDPATVRRPHRRRAGTVAGIVLGLSGLGLGVAAAGGLLPGPLWGDPVEGAFNAAPGTDRLAVTNTDAQGRSIELWISDAAGDEKGEQGYCTAFVVPSAARPGQPYPGHEGGGCSGDVGTQYWTTFAGTGTSVGDLFASHVPGATRVVLVQPDGRRQELNVGEGWTVGRLAPGAGDPVLIGYDRSGREIGRATPLGLAGADAVSADDSADEGPA